ncbi:hypothetical protein ROZALSC1DRAFT_30346, partial [Rozella allomycis CSF55]
MNSISNPNSLKGYISNPSISSGISTGESISKSENKLKVPSSGFSSCVSPLIHGDTKNNRLELEEISSSLISKMIHIDPKLKDERILLQSSLNHDNQNKWLSQLPFGLNMTGKENKMNHEQKHLLNYKIYPMQIERDDNIGNECLLFSGEDIPRETLSGNEIQDDYNKDFSPGEMLSAPQTNLEIFVDPLQHPFHLKENHLNIFQSKSISKMNLPMVDCSLSSSEANDVQVQNQSNPPNLNHLMAPFQHTSKSISESKMDLPLKLDVPFQIQPVYPNLETCEAPIQHPSLSLSLSKSKIKMDLPSENDVFQSKPVFTNLEISMDPLQNPLHSIESLSNLSPSKSIISKMNFDYSQSSSEANDDQSQNQSVLINSEDSMDPLQHPFQSKENHLNLFQSKSMSKMNLPMVDCNQSSSKGNVAQNQSQSILINLEDSTAPLEHPSISTSKFRMEMDLPLEDDSHLQNQPVLINLEDSMAPLQQAWISKSKPKIKMDLPLKDEVLFQNQHVFTRMGIIQSPQAEHNTTPTTKSNTLNISSAKPKVLDSPLTLKTKRGKKSMEISGTSLLNESDHGFKGTKAIKSIKS